MRIRIGLLIFFYCYKLCAQNIHSTFNNILNDHKPDMYSLALYPHNFRETIFKACLNPEGIVKLNEIQKTYTQKVKKIIAALTKADQLKILHLSKYKSLLSILAHSNTNDTNLKSILANYPIEIYEDASYISIMNHDLLLSLDNVIEEFNESFSIVVSVYTKDEQDSFQTLVNNPEAMQLLLQNIPMAVSLGDLFKLNAVFLAQKFDSLNLEITKHLELH